MGLSKVFELILSYLLCGTNRLLMASTLKIPASQTKVASLCCCKVSLFILPIATQKYGYNPNMKTIVKKPFVVLCWTLLANFNNLS